MGGLTDGGGQLLNIPTKLCPCMHACLAQKAGTSGRGNEDVDLKKALSSILETGGRLLTDTLERLATSQNGRRHGEGRKARPSRTATVKATSNPHPLDSRLKHHQLASGISPPA